MRARNIKPGYFTNEQLADCSDAAQILFAGLWCAADKDGLLEDRPRKLKAEIFPHKDRDIDALLTELNRAGLIIRYQRDGRKCVFIPGFREHQNPHPKEKSAGLPFPSNEPAVTLNDQPEISTAGQNLKISGPAESTSLLLNPESTFPSREREGEEECKPRDIKADREAFERFWAMYPHKLNQHRAETTWNALLMTPGFDTAVVLSALELQVKAGMLETPKGSQDLRASNWLGDRRWTDVIDPKRLPKPPPDEAAANAKLLAERQAEADRIAELRKEPPVRLAPPKPKGPDP